MASLALSLFFPSTIFHSRTGVRFVNETESSSDSVSPPTWISVNWTESVTHSVVTESAHALSVLLLFFSARSQLLRGKSGRSLTESKTDFDSAMLPLSSNYIFRMTLQKNGNISIKLWFWCRACLPFDFFRSLSFFCEAPSQFQSICLKANKVELRRVDFKLRNSMKTCSSARKTENRVIVFWDDIHNLFSAMAF